MTDNSDQSLALIFIAMATIVIVALLLTAATLTPPPTDRAFLATEISRLHDDVRVLQTQVGPKQ